MNVRARLCASLLSAARPVTPKDLARVLDVPEGEVDSAIDDLRRAISDADLGLQVEQVAGGFRLVVHPSVVPMLGTLFAPPPLPPLSRASLETLALVAYHQPVTRGELEVARGATCASTLDTLQERELVKVVGRKEVIGRPMLYGTTDKFLIEFGLASLDDLPPVDEVQAPLLRG